MRIEKSDNFSSRSGRISRMSFFWITRSPSAVFAANSSCATRPRTTDLSASWTASVAFPAGSDWNVTRRTCFSSMVVEPVSVFSVIADWRRNPSSFGPLSAGSICTFVPSSVAAAAGAAVSARAGRRTANNTTARPTDSVTVGRRRGMGRT